MKGSVKTYLILLVSIAAALFSMAGCGDGAGSESSGNENTGGENTGGNGGENTGENGGDENTGENNGENSGDENTGGNNGENGDGENTGENSGDGETDDFVAVRGITGVSAVVSVNTATTLSGVVVPETASHKEIVWTLADAGETGAAFEGNVLTVTTTGALTVLATAAQGVSETEAYEQEFVIQAIDAEAVKKAASEAVSVAASSDTDEESLKTALESIPGVTIPPGFTEKAGKDIETVKSRVKGLLEAIAGAGEAAVVAETLIALNAYLIADTGMKPEAPGEVTMEYGDGKLLVSWTASQWATDYEIYSDSKPCSPLENFSPPLYMEVKVTQTEVQAFSGAWTYIWVKAKNSVGASDYSNFAAGTLPVTGVTLTNLQDKLESFAASSHSSELPATYGIYAPLPLVFSEPNAIDTSESAWNVAKTAITAAGDGEYVTLSGAAWYTGYFVTLDFSASSFKDNTVSNMPVNLAGITLPGSVTSIGESAFNGCTGLAAVTLPGSVTSIGESAFNGCTGLAAVTLPGSVTSIGESAFSGCTGLTAVTLPGSVSALGDNAFSGCTGLVSMTVPVSLVPATDDYTSGFVKIVSGYTGLAVTLTGGGAIADYAFSGCGGLAAVSIGGGVTSIGYSAFSGCGALASVSIGGSVNSIGSYAFSGCGSLASVTIPGGVASIGSSAFMSCGSLASVTFDGSNTVITGGSTSTFPDGSSLLTAGNATSASGYKIRSGTYTRSEGTWTRQ